MVVFNNFIQINNFGKIFLIYYIWNIILNGIQNMQQFFMKSLSVKIPKSACEKWMDFSTSMKNKENSYFLHWGQKIWLKIWKNIVEINSWGKNFSVMEYRFFSHDCIRDNKIFVLYCSSFSSSYRKILTVQWVLKIMRTQLPEFSLIKKFWGWRFGYQQQFAYQIWKEFYW